MIRGGAIGDFILTLPAIAALRAHFPEAQLEGLGYPHIVQLAVAGGLVDQVHSIEARSLAGFFARGGSLAGDLVDYFSEFDLIISYLYDPDAIFRTNVGLCGRAQFTVGPHRPEDGCSHSAALVYLKPLERLAIFETDPIPRLRLDAIEQKSSTNGPADSRLQMWMTQGREQALTLAMHPGSGGEHKNWPEAKWTELVRRLLNETPFRLLLVGGEAELDRLDRLATLVSPGRGAMARSLPLPELASRLSNCAAFVGHDSGISHLAAALGLDGLVLWGDTRVEVWRPPSEKMVVVRHPLGLVELSATEVIGKLKSLPMWQAVCGSVGRSDTCDL